MQDLCPIKVKAEPEQDFEVSSTNSLNGLFVHWRQTWRATNHLLECCGRHEWLGTFSCCSFQRSFSFCIRQNCRTASLRFGDWRNFRHLASGSRTIPEALAQTVTGQVGRNFLTEVPQQDGNKHRGLLETCRPLCMLRFAL